MPKHTRQLRIDAPQFDPNAPAAGGSVDVVFSPAPPAIATVEAPSGLTLATLLSRSAGTPTALVNATWTPPDGYDASTTTATLSYLIQWSTDSTFATNTNGAAALQPSAAIDGLATGTLYYFQVAAVYRTVQSPYSASASITTALDTTPPSVVTSAAAVFVGGGDLVITWVNGASDNYRDAEIKIYTDSGKTVTLATLYNATGRQVWTVAQNLAATSGAGDASVFVEIRSRSWGGIFSAIVTVGTITKAAPAAPTVTLTGYSQLLVCQVTSTPEAPTSLFEYAWKRDGSTVRTDLVADTSATYTAGAAADQGVHSWTCTVRQKDAFGQFSSATTSSSTTLDTLTISYLRGGAFYSDSDGNSYIPPSSGTLAALKDATVLSGGVNYNP